MTLKFIKNKNYQHLCDQFHAWLVNDLAAFGVVHVDAFVWCHHAGRFTMVSCNLHWALDCHRQNTQTFTQPWAGDTLCWLPVDAPLAKAWTFWHGAGESLLWRQDHLIFHLVFKHGRDAMPWFAPLKRHLAHGRYLVTQQGKYLKPHQLPWFSHDWLAGWSNTCLEQPPRRYHKGDFAGLMLTATEQIHLDYLALGLTYKDIALRRGVSDTAVRKIYANIKRKLNEPHLPSSQLLLRLQGYGFVPLVGEG